jgi:hypothetical protein
MLHGAVFFPCEVLGDGDEAGLRQCGRGGNVVASESDGKQ